MKNIVLLVMRFCVTSFYAQNNHQKFLKSIDQKPGHLC